MYIMWVRMCVDVCMCVHSHTYVGVYVFVHHGGVSVCVYEYMCMWVCAYV